MKILPVLINLASCAAIVFVGSQGVETWESFGQSARVDGSLVLPSSKVAHKISLDRAFYDESSIRATADKNLFRRQRTEYVKPKVVKVVRRPKVVKVVAAPPPPPPKVEEPPPEKTVYIQPQLTLEGVVLLPGRKIAILDGEYPLKTESVRVKYVPLRTKRFTVGESIGDFRITRIERNKVVLTDPNGDDLKLYLDVVSSRLSPAKRPGRKVAKSRRRR